MRMRILDLSNKRQVQKLNLNKLKQRLPLNPLVNVVDAVVVNEVVNVVSEVDVDAVVDVVDGVPLEADTQMKMVSSSFVVMADDSLQGSR